MSVMPVMCGFLQARLQQYMVTTDEQLISLTHAIKNCPVINNSRQESQASERATVGRRLVDNVGRWRLIVLRLLLNYLISSE